MGGFVALYNLDGAPADEAALLAMTAALAHRGADGREIWIDGNVGLGAVFNRTTAESRFDRLIPPATGGRVVIAADARIDNRAELGRALGHDPDAIADSALIALAYEKWGERCVEHLVGDFAFALWDVRARALFAARDHIGVKPFYYHAGTGTFAAASNVGGLFASLPALARGLDDGRIAAYLLGSFDDVESTFHAGVKRLPGSESLTVAGGATARRVYATLDAGPTLRLASDADYADAFRERFTEAVRCRMRSPYPVGAALSGGLDSSSVVCVARSIAGECGGAPVHTYSVVFDEVPESDERPFIESVIAGGGVEPHFIRGDLTPPLPDAGAMHRYLEEPFYAPNMSLHWEMFKAAGQSGVRVWLDGLDGDSTVSHGVAFLAELARSMRWVRLYREGSAFARRQGMSPGKLFRGMASRPVLDPIRRRRAADRSRRAPWAGLAVNPELAARHWPAGLPAAPRARTAVEDHLRKLRWGLHPFLLESLDRAAAAFGVEPRYPFYDRRLIEFSLSLPADQKLRGGWTRWILRNAMAGVLPDDVAWRTGKGNPAPSFMRALRMFEGERMRRTLSDPGLARYLDMASVAAYLRRFAEGSAPEGEVLELWKAYTLAVWLERAGA